MGRDISLFRDGEFAAHSGAVLPFKIDCDALTDEDVDTLAAEIARRIRFGAVVGVPRGGLRLAQALIIYIDDRAPTLLIVDDVLTTGRSMEDIRLDRSDADIKGAVIFARGPCPDWIVPLFKMTEA